MNTRYLSKFQNAVPAKRLANGKRSSSIYTTLEEAEAENEFALQWHATLSKATIIRCCTLIRKFDRHRESEKKNICQQQNHRLKPKEIIESTILDFR